MPCRSGFDLDRLRAMRAYLLAMGRYGPGVTYTVPRWATINAPPPMGPLVGIWHDVYWSHECALTAPPCPCYLKRNGRDHPFGLFVYDKSDQDFSLESSVCSEEKTITKRVNIFRVFFSTLSCWYGSKVQNGCTGTDLA